MMTTDPAAVVSWDVFQHNQLPYLELRRPFILGTAQQQWKATLAHWFMRVCYDKGLLKRIYTQNIDGLDFQLGIPTESIVSVHGTMGEVSCEFCGADYPVEDFCTAVQKNVKDIYRKDPDAPENSSPVPCIKCKLPGVKPSTVLYGRQLPEKFFKLSRKDLPKADLLIVTGTSLGVSPANSVVYKVGKKCPRLIVNAQQVGEDLGFEYKDETGRDFFYQGYSDEGFLQLARDLGWLHDLNAYAPRMALSSQKLLADAMGESAAETEEKK